VRRAPGDSDGFAAREEFLKEAIGRLQDVTSRAFPLSEKPDAEVLRD